MATLADVRDNALVKLGHIDDGAVDPALLTALDAAITSSVVQLQADYPVRLLKTRGAIAWSAGVQDMTAPTDLEAGNELAAFWRTGGVVYPLRLGVDPADETLEAGLPAFAEVGRLTRWDDQQAVTTLAIRIAPAPSEAGTLLIDYVRAQPTIEDDDTEIVLDAELVALDAALSLVDTIAPQQRKTLEAQWKRHSASVRGKQSAGRDFSFSPWRRRGA